MFERQRCPQWYSQHTRHCKILQSFPQISLLDFYFEKLTLIPAPQWLQCGSSVIHCNISVQECWPSSQPEPASGQSRLVGSAPAVLVRTVRSFCQKSKIENYPQVILSGYFTLPPFYHPHSSINSTHDMPSRSSNQVRIETDNTRLEKPLLVFIIEHWFLFLWNRNHASMVYNLSGANK